MNSRLTALFIGLFALVALVLGWRLFQTLEGARGTFAPVTLTQPSVLDKVSFGASRGGFIVVNPSTAQVYAAEEDVPALAAIDARTGKVTAEIPLRGFHEGIALNPTKNEIYVGQAFSQTVRVIDGYTNKVARELPVPGGSPIGALAFDTNTNRLYVVQNDIKTIAILDYRDGTLLGTLPIDAHYGDLKINSQTERLYVSSPLENKVRVVDTSNDSIVTTIPVGNNPKGIAINPATQQIYVAITNDNAVAVIDGETNTLLTTTPVGEAPIDVAVNPYTDRVYVSNFNSQDFSIIDGPSHRVVATLPLPAPSGFLAVLPHFNRVYMSSSEGHGVVVIQDAPARASGESLILSDTGVLGLAVENAEPPAQWNQADFDDSRWTDAAHEVCLQNMPRLDNDAKWVWLPGCSQYKQTVLFRRTFDLSAKPQQAVLSLRADDTAQVYLNGHLLGETRVWTTENWYDLAPFLVQGKNVLAIQARNEMGYGALLFQGTLSGSNTR